MALNGLNFPADFRWGTATASYQIEGGATEGGRGPSIWDTFSHTPGKVSHGDTGDIASDHYHRWPEDIALMQTLGLHSYRFSIAWPRIFPTGRGQVNREGLDFYSRLIDGLLEADITPFVTLYHWDLPQALQDEGGWLRRGIVDDFTVYADTVVRAFGDRVKYWITINEPWVFTWLGGFVGNHAPGLDTRAQPAPTRYANTLRASHHVLLAHAAAVETVRTAWNDAQVGLSFSLSPTEPLTDAPEDVAAARRHDGHINRWYLDAVYTGDYPADMVDYFGEASPTANGTVQEGDMARICQPTDFMGVNYYFRSIMQHDAASPMVEARQVVPEGEHTEMGWEVYPNGLYQLLTRLSATYAPKAIYVTESGIACNDEVTHEDGKAVVHDPQRVRYLHNHFEAAARALAEGVPLKGYFVWSLLDNFEWAEGFSKRFGICYVDYATGERILKDSARFLAQVAAPSGTPTEEPTP